MWFILKHGVLDEQWGKLTVFDLGKLYLLYLVLVSYTYCIWSW